MDVGCFLGPGLEGFLVGAWERVAEVVDCEWACVHSEYRAQAQVVYVEWQGTGWGADSEH